MRVVVMRLITALIIILSLLLVLNKPHALRTEEELALSLEALSLINGDPQEIAEEEYFKKLYREENGTKKNYYKRCRDRNSLKIKKTNARYDKV